MHIRSYQAPDSPDIKTLISSVMKKEYPGDEKAYEYGDLENIAHAYGNLKEKFLVMEEGGQIIGTVGIKQDSETTALLRRLFVHPSHRGRNIGLMLVDTALDFCKMNKYKLVVFRATAGMASAIKLLTKKKNFVESERLMLNDIEIVMLHYKIC
ncbi:MAG: GNAT family N-acetyltransferase [Candidatus Omnitrophica bacterium]|nr:GNAT family N-acetyltransferase [Candidatus Omnitrophota bacterium]